MQVGITVGSLCLGELDVVAGGITVVVSPMVKFTVSLISLLTGYLGVVHHNDNAHDDDDVLPDTLGPRW